jgi:hypothetical protein
MTVDYQPEGRLQTALVWYLKFVIGRAEDE